MNSLPGRAALSLCRRAAGAGAGGGGMRVFAGSPGHPAALQAVRVCHSGANRKGNVSTKKRGYDITRNPHLNKVSSVMCVCGPPTKGPQRRLAQRRLAQREAVPRLVSRVWCICPGCTGDTTAGSL